MNNIPMVDLQGQYRALEAELKPAVESVMASGAYVNGPDTKQFTQEFAAFLQAGHAVPCANGTDALHIALRSLDIGPGDEVITSTFTFIASAGTISLTGATPVFADIEDDSFNLDPAAVEAAVTPRTRAIVPVHLYGRPANMDRIMEISRKHKLAVVEDCAQAAGATYKGKMVGTIGTIGCFSFYPSKNLGCYGDGGMIVTGDAQLAERMRATCDHGSRERYYHDTVGFNSRLDSVQAAILRIKLRHLKTWNEGRRAAARMYGEALASSGVRLPQESADSVHVYHQYTIRHSERDRIQQQLQKAGIASAIYYPVPLHLQKTYASLGHSRGAFPVAEKATAEVLSLPMYPELTRELIDRVAGEVRAALTGVAASS
jgi:dTDP-4-amino-4,6-dideoxygalactose transaminase